MGNNSELNEEPRRTGGKVQAGHDQALSTDLLKNN